MGIYLNPENENFKATLTREIYVDKTIAGNMLSAYYSKGCDSWQLFSPCSQPFIFHSFMP